jgi:hypothetical protein
MTDFKDRMSGALREDHKAIGDIDYLIMSSANDEDRLAERWTPKIGQ